MSISRRKFMRAGTLVALAAALPVSMFGQNRKDRDGNPDDRGVPNDPLAFYSSAAFASYLNSIFQVSTGYSVVEVALTRVKELPTGGTAAPAGGECFSLLFVGGSKGFEQGTYKIDHPSLGSFQMFLVPGGPDVYGAQTYLATINRIGYSPTLGNPPAPRTKTSDTIKPENPTKTQPAIQPVLAPATPAPQGPAPKTEPKRKPIPSWKRDGTDRDFESLLIDKL